MSKDFKKFWEILKDFKRCEKILRNFKRLQQNKVKKVGIISVFSSIVIEGIRTILFTNPTFNKPKKEFSTLNYQLSIKKISRGWKICN